MRIISPIISVIIPTYKRPVETVMRAIKSVLSQTLSPSEIIVVDDSPTDFKESDSLRQAIEKENENIVYLKHPLNMGACAARNTGITNSTGEFVAFLDDDDEWMPEKLEKQISCFEDEQCGLVYCDCILSTDDKASNNISNRRNLSYICYSGQVHEKLAKENFIGSTSFVVVRKSCFDDVGMFDNDFESCQDYDMWLRIAGKYLVKYVDEPLVKYSLHDNEKISTDYNKCIQGLELLIKKHNMLYRQHPFALAKHQISIAGHHRRLGSKRNSFKLYIKFCWGIPYVLFEKLTRKGRKSA